MILGDDDAGAVGLAAAWKVCGEGSVCMDGRSPAVEIAHRPIPIRESCLAGLLHSIGIVLVWPTVPGLDDVRAVYDEDALPQRAHAAHGTTPG